MPRLPTHLRTPRLPRSLLVGLSVAVTTSLVVAGLPAAATAGTPAQVSATIVLRTPDPAALTALAQARAISKADRHARLAALMPTRQVRASLLSSLGTLGLTVNHTTDWTVSVTGSAVAVARVMASGVRSGAAVSTSPSLLPGAGALISGGPDHVFRPMVSPVSAAQLRAVYGASSSVPAGSARPVIATVEFGGWDSSDLAAYATQAHLPAPLPGTYTGISVDGSSLTDIEGDASLETALDQETIFAVDPYAQQRAYVEPNNATGDIDALAAVADDAQTGGIAALSLSWGLCETVADTDTAYLEIMHSLLASIVAAGTTVFASTGDSGSNGCATNPATNVVNYPAADPLVVAVGGTTLQPAGPVETAWGAPGATPADFVGSGGGVSATWPRPAYQAAVAPAEAGRELPDIAADGDPETGFTIVFDGASGAVGGTSLSAPLSAALLTAELGSRGIVNGVGDIHGALYSAPATAFRDITSGTNGAYDAGPGYDLVTGLGAPNWHAIVDQLTRAPIVSAPARTASRTVALTVTAPGSQSFVGWATGYGTPPACDTAVGKAATPAAVTLPADGSFTLWAEGYVGGHQCFVGTTTTVVDSSGPAVSLSAKASTPTGRSMTYTWAVSDPAGVAAVSAYVYRNGKRIWNGSSTGSGRVVLRGTLGSVYQLVVVATDSLGNVSTNKRNVDVAYDDRSFHLSSGWARLTSHAAFGGSIVRSAKAKAAARLTAYGSTYALVTTKCATCGVVQVYVDGHHLRDLSLDAVRSQPQARITIASFGSARARSILLVVKGAHAGHSKGNVVMVDGLLAA